MHHSRSTSLAHLPPPHVTANPYPHSASIHPETLSSLLILTAASFTHVPHPHFILTLCHSSHFSSSFNLNPKPCSLTHILTSLQTNTHTLSRIFILFLILTLPHSHTCLILTSPWLFILILILPLPWLVLTSPWVFIYIYSPPSSLPNLLTPHFTISSSSFILTSSIFFILNPHPLNLYFVLIFHYLPFTPTSYPCPPYPHFTSPLCSHIASSWLFLISPQPHSVNPHFTPSHSSVLTNKIPHFILTLHQYSNSMKCHPHVSHILTVCPHTLSWPLCVLTCSHKRFPFTSWMKIPQTSFTSPFFIHQIHHFKGI